MPKKSFSHHRFSMAFLPYLRKYMATLAQRFGNHIQRLRKQRKISQFELAQKANLDLTTINEIENGNREPMLKTVWKIANALDVKLGHLFDF